jgi:hypothetical protein
VRRPLPVVGAAGLAVLVVAALWGSSGAASLPAGVVALCLAPVAVWAVAKTASRLDPRPGFGTAAAIVYVLLPPAGALYFVASYRHFYLHEVAPSLVGLSSPAWFALGVGIAVVLAHAPARLLAVAGVAAAATAAAYWGTGPLHDIRNGLHETAWSITFLVWLVLAGMVGVARRSRVLAVAVGGWLVFFVLRGAPSGYAAGAFWRSLAPALPALALLLRSLWLLVPRLRPDPAASPAR